MFIHYQHARDGNNNSNLIQVGSVTTAERDEMDISSNAAIVIAVQEGIGLPELSRVCMSVTEARQLIKALNSAVEDADQ